MKKLWKKRLPASLLALALIVGLMPAALASHTHSQTSDWTRNENSHWHACSGCDEHLDEAAHDFQEVSTTPATCYQSGLIKRQCKVCGYATETTTSATGSHVYDETRWTSDNTHHWHACTTNSCTSVADKAAHVAKGAGTITNPTCTAAGSIAYECEFCARKYTVAGSPAMGHSYVNGVCSRCGAKDSSTVTVTFRNGSNTYATQTITKGGKPSNPGTPAYPGTGGYAFKGWTTSNPGSSAAYTNQSYYTSSQVANTAVSANTTYYAIYDVPVIPTVTYTAVPGDAEAFDAEDFNEAYQTAMDTSNDIRWVEFSVPSSYSSFEGEIILNYGEDTQESLTRSQLNGSTFYYEDAEEGDYALESLSFVPDEAADTDILTIDFTAYRSNGSYAEGYLVLEIGETAEALTITYKVDADDEVVFDRTDFNELFQTEYSSYSVRYVEFSASVSYTNSDGVIYIDYEGNDELSFSRTELNRAVFYYNDSSYGDYALSELSFVTGSNFDKTLEIPFTAYYNSSRYVEGTLVIKFADEAGDIAYTVAPGGEVAFDPADFNDYFQTEADTSYDFKYITFTTADTLSSSSSGLVYYDYDGDDERSFNKSTLEDFYFYYDDADDGDYALDLLSFVAGSNFDETITLEFNAYYSSNRQASGTLTITPEEVKEATAAGDILYMTPYTTSVQLNAHDFARFYEKQYPNSDFLYARINGVPETGGLYYNYYGASAYGTTARLKLTAANCDDQNLYLSPTSSSQYALTELTYVPSSTNYCALIPFTAYGSNNRSVTGTVLISVSLRTVSEVYGVTPKDTSVSFPVPSLAAAIASATGSNPASIQLLRLPASTVGTIYVGSDTSRKATTEDLYGYSSGTWRMSHLRFVPASGYTGSVEIPYVAYDSGNKAVAAGNFCLGVVESIKRFSDVASSSVWCYKYVMELSAASVIDGYTDGTFKPDNTISYGAALKLVMLAAGYPEQAPTGTSPFSGYLDKARSEGIITRSSVDLTKPITRLQVAQLAAGALKLDIENLSSVKPFTDTADLHVQALNAAGIINGYFENGTSAYRPDNTLSRGQASAIVWRMLNYKK